MPNASKLSSDPDTLHAKDPGSEHGPPLVSRTLTICVVIIGIVIYFLSGYEVNKSSSYILCTKGGKIYTVDPNAPMQECLGVSGKRFFGVGTLGELEQSWEAFELENKEHNGKLHFRDLPIRYITGFVFPAFNDAHAHILEYGASRQLFLEGTKSVNDTVRLVREYILANPDIYNDPSKYIVGGGWDHTNWPGGAWPTAADLESDPTIRGRPVILQSKDCHALWLSFGAVEASKPLPGAVDGGIILRDEHGDPNGVFLDNAQGLIKAPPPSEEDLIRHFSVTVRDALSFGITTIHDAGLTPVSLEFFKRRAKGGSFPIRVYGMRYFDEGGEYWGNMTEPIIREADDRLTARSVKIFADGALRTGGAALFEPYADNPSTNGFMRLPMSVLTETIPQFLRDGWQVNVHAIGDRANHLVINAFESALVDVNVTALRPRLEHAQILTSTDIKRLGKLGVIVSMQPTHAISDFWYAQDRLGAERVKQLYAFRSIVDSGARIALGTDAPVEDINPLKTFYAAVTRKSPDGKSPHGPGGWFPEQRLTRMEALKGMTLDSAYASFADDSFGSISAGKRADYIVLSQDIMEIPETEILNTKVLATFMDGESVYSRQLE